MRVLRKMPSPPYSPTKYEVQCEGCENTFVITAWRSKITPERKCASCGAKNRVLRLRKLRGAA